MSELKYSLGVFAKGTNNYLAFSELAMIIPGDNWTSSEWLHSEWNENNKSRKLMQGVGEKKKFGFLTHPFYSSYWSKRFHQQNTIPTVIIQINVAGTVIRNHLSEVKVITPSAFPFPFNKESVLLFYTLEFQDSDISPIWSLNNPN